MGLVQEFKEFAVKGNAIDMAVGIVIGGAFTPIVKSLVDDVLMPPIGLLTAGIDFSELRWTLREATADTESVTLNYGNLVNVLITFAIVAFAVFLLVKGMNALRREEQAEPVAPTDKNCPHCQMSIPIQATKCGHCTSAI